MIPQTLPDLKANSLYTRNQPRIYNLGHTKIVNFDEDETRLLLKSIIHPQIVRHIIGPHRTRIGRSLFLMAGEIKIELY